MNRKGAGGRTSNLAIDDCRSARLTEGRTSGIKLVAHVSAVVRDGVSDHHNVGFGPRRKQGVRPN